MCETIFINILGGFALCSISLAGNDLLTLLLSRLQVEKHEGQINQAVAISPHS